jgi:anti-sigma factor RsiW
MKRCLDEETIQRLLDDELAGSARGTAEAHAEVCRPCLDAMREAEREEAQLSSLFAPRLSIAVPTARLWGAIRTAAYGGSVTGRYKG